MGNELISENLFARTLTDPIVRMPELDSLLIVSGYASSAMGFHHLMGLKRLGFEPRVSLVCGMVKADGITKSNHEGFQQLARTNFPQRFSCAYVKSGEPVHAKIYIWCRGNEPIVAYTGSANYTQTAFLNSSRREVLAECNPKEALDFYAALKGDTIDCGDKTISKFFNIGWQRRGPREQKPISLPDVPFTVEQDPNSPFFGKEKAVISLVDKRGVVPERSGLNWGQRPELHRDPNQAYLSVRGDLRKTDFFPPITVHFTVLTDDNQLIQCTRAQQDGKGIHTPHDNAEIGRYFRRRLGLRDGAMVTSHDLKKYGRSDVVFYKIDDENYFMDFSSPKK